MIQPYVGTCDTLYREEPNTHNVLCVDEYATEGEKKILKTSRFNLLVTWPGPPLRCKRGITAEYTGCVLGCRLVLWQLCEGLEAGFGRHQTPEGLELGLQLRVGPRQIHILR